MQNSSYHMLELENWLLYKGLFSYVGRVTSLAKFVLACLGVRLDSNGWVFYFWLGSEGGGGGGAKSSKIV